MQIGTQPYITGPQLVDGQWLLALAGGANRSTKNGLTAHSGGTKAAALQIDAGQAFVKFGTVGADADSALLPAAKAGVLVLVQNAGAHTLDLYGKGTDTINLNVTATAYALTTGQCALFFCAQDGNWGAIKTA